MPATVLKLAPEEQPRSFLNGMIQNVTPFKSPLESVELSVNGHFDVLGAWTSRLGITQLGDSMTTSRDIAGLFNFRDAGTGTNNQIIAVSNTTLKYLNASSVWTNIRTGLTADAKSRFVTFLDVVFHLNGKDATLTWDGNPSGAFDTTQASGAPIASFGDVFKGKVYLGGNDDEPDRLFFSSAVSSTNTISWDTSSTGDFVDISPNDGQNMQAVKRFARELLIFKDDFLYRYYGVAGTDPDPVINVGTQSQESVISSKIGITFHHPGSNSIQLYDGNYPREISRPIIPFFQAMPLSYYSEVSAWVDDDHLYYSLGDLTIAGVTFNNVVARRTISSQVWTVYTYSTELKVGTPYNDGTTQLLVVGDNNGKVYKFNNGNTDDGTAIACRLETKFYEWGGISTHKVISKLSAICQKAKNIHVAWQGDDDTDVHPIGTCNKFLTVFPNKIIKGHRIKFIITASMSTAPFTFEGLEIIDAISEGVID